MDLGAALGEVLTPEMRERMGRLEKENEILRRRLNEVEGAEEGGGRERERKRGGGGGGEGGRGRGRARERGREKEGEREVSLS